MDPHNGGGGSKSYNFNNISYKLLNFIYFKMSNNIIERGCDQKIDFKIAL